MEEKELTVGQQLRKALTYQRKNGYDCLQPGELEAIAKGTAKITATAGDGRKAEVTIKVDRVAQSLAISSRSFQSPLFRFGFCGHMFVV